LPDFNTSVEFGITDLSRFISRVLTLVNESISNGEFHGGALTLLQLLQAAEVPYAVVSSSSRELILKGAARHACDALLPHLVTRHDVTQTKPNPEPLLKALSLLNAKPDRAVMIGDNSVDMLAGQALGMDTFVSAATFRVL
jgi:pyrophosphatase PpaX